MITDNLNMDPEQANQLPILSLAYMGDCVFEMLVRETLLSCGNYQNGRLHIEAKKYVSARGQSSFLSLIEEKLNEKELQIYKRGRNSHPNLSRNINISEYHQATGIEALFGYLYLTGDIGRINELFNPLENEIKNSIKQGFTNEQNQN